MYNQKLLLFYFFNFHNTVAHKTTCDELKFQVKNYIYIYTFFFFRKLNYFRDFLPTWVYPRTQTLYFNKKKWDFTLTERVGLGECYSPLGTQGWLLKGEVKVLISKQGTGWNKSTPFQFSLSAFKKVMFPPWVFFFFFFHLGSENENTVYV